MLTTNTAMPSALAFLSGLLLAILARQWTLRDKKQTADAAVQVATVAWDTEFRKQLFQRIADLEKSVQELTASLDVEQERHQECKRRCDALDNKVQVLEQQVAARRH